MLQHCVTHLALFQPPVLLHFLSHCIQIQFSTLCNLVLLTNIILFGFVCGMFLLWMYVFIMKFFDVDGESFL